MGPIPAAEKATGEARGTDEEQCQQAYYAEWKQAVLLIIIMAGLL
jgi:hypothetical protein